MKRTLKKPGTDIPRRVLSELEAAGYCGVGLSTLQKYRGTGGGPAFVQLGARRLGYRIEDLDAWIASRPAYRTTSERDAQAAA